MSLTYQPFAAVPEVSALGEELKHNVNDKERYGSIAAGAGILVGSLFGHGLGRLLMMAAAGALVYRGVTGHCHVYERLGVSTRQPESVTDTPQLPDAVPSAESTKVAA
ncbi:DUF2892 family protein [Roseimicrobium gellanilyticum]|uniref:DUF2892 family protein n=1 Tax=Roseimicrobium gellanilyticum TaxID=748857 RepID=A0A366HW23_9BACT|nr:DUF2892 domain-containing protein [Roseimicrobium gellanilyticum]RBP47784.1 DUF2892 family protein [Roseimicrobium gellanilyticum]